MTNSLTVSHSQTFTVTHARHLAAKVATDLKRMQRFYGRPSDREIDYYEAEAIELLKAGYLGTVKYGFRRNGSLVPPTLLYTAHDLAAGAAADQNPGRVFPGADIRGADFYSYLTYSQAWWQASPAEREAVEQRLPFRRESAAEPGLNGRFVSDRSYSSGGRALNRSSLRSW